MICTRVVNIYYFTQPVMVCDICDNESCFVSLLGILEIILTRLRLIIIVINVTDELNDILTDNYNSLYMCVYNDLFENKLDVLTLKMNRKITHNLK